MLIRRAEVWGHGPADLRITDLRITDGRIAAIGDLAPLPCEAVIEAAGGLLLPGLHDHHLHLAALAARRASVVCGPPEVCGAEDLAAALAAAPGTGWLRGILYHDSVMGLPDAAALDRLCPDRPLRIQHRSGRLWLLNSAALCEVLGRAAPPPGLEREDGRPTGRLFDEDGWLRAALGGAPPALDAVGRELASYGITGVTEMSPGNDRAAAAWLAAERATLALPQRLILAGTLDLAAVEADGWTLGPAKLHLHEAALPDPDAAAAFIAAAHAQGRGVAIHCTSHVELVYALAVLEAAGPVAGDRIEHAGVAHDPQRDAIAAMGLAVVSQPHFIAERGDAYARDVEPEDRAALYRLAAFRDAGVPLAAGSDAPFGLPDPWAAMRAATSRATRAGLILGADEALSAEAALGLFLADPEDLARQRGIAVGAPADLCLLGRSWAEARERLSAGDVCATFIGGRLVHQRVDQPPIERGTR